MNKRIEPKAGVGVASILLIVAVLCMTVFASLSLLTAKNDAELTEKTVAASAAYYEADALAQQRIADVADFIATGESLPDGVAREENGFSFTQPVSDGLGIYVRLDEHGSATQYSLRRTEDDMDHVILDLWK